MPVTVKGERPRPRVALVGMFDIPTSMSFRRFFPTFWMGSNTRDIEYEISANEIDLVVIAPDYEGAIPEWFNRVHIICFSSKIGNLPSPAPNVAVHCRRSTSTEKYLLPEVPLNIERLREVDLADLENTKGWNLISPQATPGISLADDIKKVLVDGALAVDPYSGLPFATIYKREKTGLQVAWLPNQRFRVYPWVELICANLAQEDPKRFPNFGNWTKDPMWMLSSETSIVSDIEQLTIKKKTLTTEIDKDIGALQQKLIRTSAEANDGMRKLVTAQGDELVNQVSNVFETLGFKVTRMDELIPDGSPKLEDLRLTQLTQPDWVAIVEVRGYTKSGGKSDDLLRLARFARFYEKETGKAPNKKIYIVNGQTDLLPSQRQRPFDSSPEDLREFAEQDGIVIWSLDLFQVIKDLKDTDPTETRNSLIDAKGRWP